MSKRYRTIFENPVEMPRIHAFFNRSIAIQAIFGCAILTSTAAGQEVPSGERDSGLEAELGLELRHDDNIFRNASDVQSSIITAVSPRLLTSVAKNLNRFGLEYSGEFASYWDSSADDYDEHQIRAGAQLALGRRINADFVGFYRDAHEIRGTGLSEGCGPDCDLLLDQPDEYKQAQVLGRFTYGALGTKGRLIFDAGQRELQYANHRDRTRFFDYEDRHVGATFNYQIMPSTSLLLDLRATEFDYANDRVLQSSLNSTEYRYLLGTAWDITGKTMGTIKVGYLEKTYADNSRADFAEPSWEVEIRWSPRSYSRLDLSTRRFPSEITSLAGDVIDNTTYSVAWSHDWSERLMTRFSTSFSDQVFRGSTSARLQEKNEYGVTLTYEMRRWLSWEFGVAVSSQDSNIDQFDFDGTVFRLGAVFAL